MRGDVVIVDFPFSDASQAKRRPALVVQADAVASVNTIIALITSNLTRTGPTRLFVDSATETGSGLKTSSVILCEALFSILTSRIIKKVGSLSAATMAQVDDGLKAALGLP
jgi:mRNA interferase MazF